MPGLISWRPFASANPATSNAGGRLHPSKPFAPAGSEKTFQEGNLPSALLSGRACLFQIPVIEALRVSQLQPSTRPKQVTDPVAETVKARLHGDNLPTERMVGTYCSSGSDHEPSSVCLAEMVHEFMESEASVGMCGRARCNCLSGAFGGEACAGGDGEGCRASISVQLSDLLQGFTSFLSKGERSLVAEVTRLISSITDEASSICKVQRPDCSNGCLKRAVMKELRAAGYNAAICKSRWDHAGGCLAGDYEYIDVLLDGLNGKEERLILDVDFRAQFEIARPTDSYIACLQVLPPIFLGKPDRIQKIIKIMSDAAKLSLKRMGLHLPPWRKPEYMLAKWLSPYKRTTNELITVCESAGGKEFAGIAVRGSGLDARYSSELELLYHEAGARLTTKKTSTSSDGRNVGEGIAERLPRSTIGFRSGKDEITVMSTDWQPPAVNPRTSQKPVGVAGLASVLMQAGLTASQARPRSATKQEESLAVAA